MLRTPAALPLSMEITRERGCLSLAAPVDLGPVRVTAMDLAIPHLRLPADLRGGASSFRCHLASLERLRLTVSGADVLAAARKGAGSPVRQVDLHGDSLVVMAAQGSRSLVARWRLLPGKDGEVVLAPLDVLCAGAARRPWHLLAEDLLDGLGPAVQARRDVDGHHLRLLPPVLDALFLRAGWRVPMGELQVVVMGTRSGKLDVEFGPAAALGPVHRNVGTGGGEGEALDRELLQRLDAARLHQDVDEALRGGDTAGALTMLYRVRREGGEWDPFLQERLLVLLSCEPGLHDEALAETDRMLAEGGREALVRSVRLSIAAHRAEGGAMAREAHGLAVALVSRGRPGAAAFVVEQVVRLLEDGARAPFLERALELLPGEPGILAARASLLGEEVPLADLLASLPFLPPGQERGALLREASRRLLAARDLRGVLALWGPDGGEPALDGRLLSEAALALDPAAPGEEARLLLERLPVLHGTGALLDPEAAARLAEAALRVQEPGALPVTAAALAPSLHAGGDAAIRLAGALEGAIPPGELLALLRSMRPAAAAAGPAAAAWVNLVFRTHVAAGFPTEAWHVLAGCDEPESPDDRSLDVIVSLVGGAATRTRALSEMVRWVERSPDRLRRAAVAGRLGIVLLDELRLPADAARYLELAWQLDREPHRWLPGLERALEASGREADLAELLATVLEDPGLAPDTEGSLHLRRGRVLLRIPGQRLEALAHLHRARELLPGEQAPERELAAAQASAPGPSRPGPGVPHQLDLACREAVALADAGDLEAARTLVRSVLAEAPDHAAAADLLDALGSGRT